MAQSSMLELLALTDAAVKGLNKSMRSSSASSRSSRGSVSKAQHHDSPSHDSGICKTNTVVEKNGHLIHDSDESTTASDVLITSTTIDPDQRSLLLQDGENLSTVSKCSKMSIGSENFNTSGAQKVKISTKRLREIKSPFDTSPREREDKENAKQSALAIRKAATKSVERSVDASSINCADKNLSKNAIAKPVASKTSNFKVQSAPRGLSEITKNKKEDDHFFSPMQTQRSETFEEFSPRDEGKELIENKGRKAHVTASNTQDPYKVSKEKAAGVIVERHTPKKMIPPGKKLQLEESLSDHGKDPTLDLSGSIDLPEKEVASHALDVSGSSRESSQPEIVTIPERIVTVSARTSLSNDASLSDTGPMEQEVERVPPMLSARYQLGSKMNGGLIRQGAPVEGATGLDKTKESPEVKISNFKMSEKQKLIRQTFAKRYEQPGPVKRVVQPRIVGADKKVSEAKGEGSKVTGQTSEAIAVAVAASAAVAATQPFLKAQQDLESKMAQILEKMAVIQNSGSATQTASETEAAVQESQRVMALERQVSQLTDQRIEHLERLQEHQLQMQAKLISLTRDTPRTRSAVGSPQRTPPQQRKFPTPGSSPPRRAFSKTTINRTPVSPKGSPLDTPAPRSRAPRPVAYDPSAMTESKTQQSKGILEEILASAGSPTNGGQGINIHQPVYSRETHLEKSRSRSKSPNVKKAEKLVQELSELKDQMTDLVTDVNNSSGKNENPLTKVEPPRGITAEELLGPSPLDPYLVLPDVVPTSPYKSVPDFGIQKVNAPVLATPAFQDARQVLKQVGQNKEFLEANLESVLRTRQEVEVYSMLENLYQDSSDTERARLQRKVNEWVANLREQVDREVTDEVVMRELQKKHQKPIFLTKEPQVVPNVPKKSYRTTTRGTQGAKVDTGLKRDITKSAVGPSLGRMPGPSMGKAPRFTEKESKTTTTARKPAIKGPPPRYPPPVSEENMYKVYGKAVYDNKRTTQKDPYLHFQNKNVSKPRSPGRPSQTADVSGGIEVRSAKSQTKGGVKQFYFSPASGSFIPVAGVASAAPIPGQLIPMAVPLGGPRMEGGLAAEATASGPVTSTPVPRPQVTASKNVALVSVPSGEEEEQISPQPELAKQVLPPVDIDTDLSEESVIRSKTGEVHLKSPSKTHFEVTFHEDLPTGTTPKDWRNQATLDDLSEDLSPETAPGLALPGYCAPSPPPEPVEIPAFPPMVTGAEKLAQASDLIAADIKRRDLLENKASEWIEHEIMAHIISELYPLKPEKPCELDHVVNEELEDSVADDREQSMFMMDAIGRDGLQMFVDMGQPVDSRLVDALVKEVLLEKVTTLLGQRPGDETTVQKEASTGRTEAKLGASMKGHETERVTTGISREDEYTAGQLRTPEPTPKASPISSPVRVLSPPVTPPSSPKVPAPSKFVQEPRVVPLESEPEDVTESLDISEEIRALREKLVPIRGETREQIYDVETPISTPVPEPVEEEREEQPPTPPLPSPRRPPKQPVLQVPVAVEEPPAPAPAPAPAPPLEEKLDVVPSPQPWGDPESPLPEENPDFQDDYMDDGANQHKPYALSVAPADESLPYPQEHVPSPPPKSPVRRRSPSPTPSETETTSIMSSVSDTYNMSVSEGQWLLSKSEGEMADFNFDEAALKRMAMQARQAGDISTASTFRDASELEEDMTDLQASEGEFQYKGQIEPEKDPMLLLLSRLQRHPPDQPPVSLPAAGQYDMSSQQVYDLLNHTGLSTGEVFMNGASVQRSQGEVIRVTQTRRSVGEVPEYEQPTRDPSSDREAARSSYGFTQSNGVTQSNDMPTRNGSPLRMTDLRSQSIQEESEPEPTPRDDSYRESVDTRKEKSHPTPTRDARPSSSRGRQSPGMRGGNTPGGVSLGAGRISSGKPAMKKPPPATPSPGLPNKTMSTTIPRTVQIRESDEQENRYSLDGGGTMSDQGTRTFTPDQMNMDDLIKSGYLTQSRSGEFGQSGGMSQSFGQSGRLSQSYDQSSAMTQSLDNKNDTRDSTDSYATRQINKGKSLGLTYSMEESLAATDSLDESELRQLATTGTLKMSVRMPALGDMEDDSERQSEFEMTDTL